MTTAYFDCFAGAAGDMIAGALIDAGADFLTVRAELDKLALAGCEFRVEKVNRGGIAGTKFHVDVADAPQPDRNLGDIVDLIRAAGLVPRVRQRAERVFTRLAEAEARIHNVTVEEVHFHEVGAVDSIMDVVAACAALELLDVETVLCSPIPVGSGSIDCRHGRIPAPAPATAQLLTGATIAHSNLTGEVTTPTGAAVLTALSESYGPIPTMGVLSVGLGAGTRDDGSLPNLLRVFIGTSGEPDDVDTVVELSVNLDDCTGEVIGRAISAALTAGCLDAWASPIVMKKSRPAWMLSVLCDVRDVEAVEKLLFDETTTFGIRRRACRRSKLRRSFQTVETRYGPVRVKIGRHAGRIVTAAPEFDDCLAAAQTHHVPVKEVLAEAEGIYRARESNGE